MAGRESPEYVRLSNAAALQLGLISGRQWRGAVLRCINLLLTYDEGCRANCAYCGLGRERLAAGGDASSKSFIRVGWPTHSLDEIIERLGRCATAERVCISMITHPRALADTLEITRRIRSACPELLISALVTPTLVRKEDWRALRDAGIEMVGIALDAATAELFAALRGKARRGPHDWERYWAGLREAVEVFGAGKVGAHLIVGLGETEREMVETLSRVHELGGVNHLFSFFPEEGSALDDLFPPPVASYRRLQLAAEIIDSELGDPEDFDFAPETGEIVSFGLPARALEEIIDEGRAFMTRGCPGRDGKVACTRNFGNSPPGPCLRNYPFEPEAEDLALIRRQLAGEWADEWAPLRNRPVRGTGALAGADPGDRAQPGAAVPHGRPTGRRAGEVWFFVPPIKHFETDELAGSGRPVFVPVSVTGETCALNCTHCRGRLLKGMYTAATPEELLDLARRLRPRGCRGMLLTGGCDAGGVVPLLSYVPVLSRIRLDLGLRTAVHTKLLDEALARELGAHPPDSVMLDVIGADETLAQIHNLPQRTVADVERGLDLAARFRLALSPHLVVGVHGGELRGERRALELLRGRKLKSLVIALLMKIGRGDPVFRISLDELQQLFAEAREIFPDVPLLLGCARPLGPLQKEIDAAALAAGFDGIAYPSEGTVARARAMGLAVRFSEQCCALMV